MATQQEVPRESRDWQPGHPRPADWAKEHGYDAYDTGGNYVIVTNPDAVEWDSKNYSTGEVMDNVLAQRYPDTYGAKADPGERPMKLTDRVRAWKEQNGPPGIGDRPIKPGDVFRYDGTVGDDGAPQQVRVTRVAKGLVYYGIGADAKKAGYHVAEEKFRRRAYPPEAELSEAVQVSVPSSVRDEFREEIDRLRAHPDVSDENGVLALRPHHAERLAGLMLKSDKHDTRRLGEKIVDQLAAEPLYDIDSAAMLAAGTQDAQAAAAGAATLEALGVPEEDRVEVAACLLALPAEERREFVESWLDDLIVAV